MNAEEFTGVPLAKRAEEAIALLCALAGDEWVVKLGGLNQVQRATVFNMLQNAWIAGFTTARNVQRSDSNG